VRRITSTRPCRRKERNGVRRSFALTRNRRLLFRRVTTDLPERIRRSAPLFGSEIGRVRSTTRKKSSTSAAPPHRLPIPSVSLSPRTSPFVARDSSSLRRTRCPHSTILNENPLSMLFSHTTTGYLPLPTSIHCNRHGCSLTSTKKQTGRLSPASLWTDHLLLRSLQKSTRSFSRRQIC
jgi:hypothetical protein